MSSGMVYLLAFCHMGDRKRSDMDKVDWGGGEWRYGVPEQFGCVTIIRGEDGARKK